MSHPELYDPGLQPERTELAWRRTALAIGVGSLIALRVLPELMESTLWVVPGLIGLAVSGILWGRARRRYLVTTHALVPGSDHGMPGAALLFGLMAFVCACGLLGLGLAVFAAMTRS